MTSLAKNMNSKKNNMLTLGALMLVMLVLALAENFLDSFSMQIFKLCAINIILALSLNLINGFTGLFSLGHAGFMAIGAYTCAVLTMSSDQKEINYVLQPIAPWLENIHMPFVPALILSGVVSCALGWFLGVVALRLRDDYLAIATLGFSEIIRVILTNAQSVTNGSLGLKGLPHYNTIW